MSIVKEQMAEYNAKRRAARAKLTPRDYQHLADVSEFPRMENGHIAAMVAAREWGITRATAQRRLRPLVLAGLLYTLTDQFGGLTYRENYPED